MGTALRMPALRTPCREGVFVVDRDVSVNLGF